MAVMPTGGLDGPGDELGAVVLAAGSGARMMPGGPPKQYASLGGKPLLAHSQALYQDLPFVASITLVVPPGDEASCAPLRSDYPKLTQVVAGGPTRCWSTRRGVEALDECGLVIVHNAASPFTPPELVRACVHSAIEHGAAAGCARSTYTSVEASVGA